MAAKPKANACQQALHEQEKIKIQRGLYVRCGLELIQNPTVQENCEKGCLKWLVEKKTPQMLTISNIINKKVILKQD